MNASRSMRTAGGLLATAAFGLAALAAAPSAAAQPLPAYICEAVNPDLPRVFGSGCEALGGAPEHGPISGDFLIANEGGRNAFLCREEERYSGLADLPYRVVGFTCQPW
ncbi:hypothetical protein [Streptomyces aidingensis]|uniref:Subtilisin inhibitor-like n=1 Tax=Streptomyces aidingensis TaxID=910347 RepID=A0A1I1U5Y3_9ACTN|nr:hypothetical protein [Streptomyces aidingensis]SFD66207.1 hypothetical protein SAMN05421773_1233 [Streptomyces aidingensis]